MRLIARLDIKNESVIKGIHLEGLRKVGDPNELARQYYQAGIDELIFMDAVASLYDRNNLFHIIAAACREVFIPITIGGGIRSLDDIHQALRAGADKVAINTAAIHDPSLIEKAAQRFGSQAIVASIEAKRLGVGGGEGSGDSESSRWLAYIDNGRDRTEQPVIPWAQQLESLGAGELFITSVDAEGTQRGFDVALVREVNQAIGIPVIACGGLGEPAHLQQLLSQCRPSAIACASVLHYNKVSVPQLKSTLTELGCTMRRLP